MKYKVIFGFNYGTPGAIDGAAMGTFYRKSEAISAAESWANLNGQLAAWFWDGSTWTQYNQ